ncbi:Methyl-CpG-binding domain-containing protein 6 [Forsythia ovata]|uniref:Methyl-CpG-binding domain-containing protein 6 n=1 Tax=Forsythia ovata TaxID=205694 RepID=A0ABD1VFR3_9LAMI
MSENSSPPPVTPPYPTPVDPNNDTGDAILPDPLLESGSFIDADQNEAEPETPPNQQRQPIPEGEQGSGSGIASEPISVAAPADGSAGPTRPPMKRNLEEMAKRPDWLPENWTIDLRVRSSGATAGSIDRYYRDPSGKKFRSKNEVMHYLETGNKLKRKPNSDAEATPSESPGSKKQKKSSSKRKKSEALKFDFLNPPAAVSWTCTNAPQETWTARVDNKRVPESRQREWAAAFQHVTEPKGNEGTSN